MLRMLALLVLLFFNTAAGFSVAAQEQSVFVVTDKVIYTPNEQLWLTALINDNHPGLKDTADILTVFLRNRVTNKRVAIKKFAIYDGFATGNILLPDSTIAAVYELVAFTNLIDSANKSAAAFSKTIKVYNRPSEKAFDIRLRLLDSLTTTAKFAYEATISFDGYQHQAKDASGWYYLENQRPQKIKFNDFGKSIIYIDAQQVPKQERALYARVIFKKDTAEMQVRIPENYIPGDSLLLRLFPEGGSLRTGTTNRIFWECINVNNLTVETRLRVYDDNKIIVDTISRADKLNAFDIIPLKNANYRLELVTDGKTQQHYFSATDAFGFRFSDLVVDSVLKVGLTAAQYGKLRFLVATGETISVDEVITLKGTKNISLLMKEIPPGLSALYILDQKNQLLGCTYFYAHFNKSVVGKISTNKEIYQLRDTIVADITIKDAGGNPVAAVVTASCVLRSRMDADFGTDLESYQYLRGLSGLNGNAVGGKRLLESKNELERVLRLNTPDSSSLVRLLHPFATRTFRKPITSLEVKKFGKRLKAPVTVALIKDEAVVFLNTDAEGHSIFSFKDLLVNDGRKAFMAVSGKASVESYATFTSDSLLAVIPTIAPVAYQPIIREKVTPKNTALVIDPEEQFVKTMAAVVVKSRNDMGTLGKTNACGDYVCQFNILNCRNHTVPYKLPVKGQQYRDQNGFSFVYMGCDRVNNLFVPPQSLIYRPRQFLGMDSSLLKQEYPEYLSTLYWKPLESVAREGKVLRFHTSDQKGIYLLMMQGITETGEPVYMEKVIRVH